MGIIPLTYGCKCKCKDFADHVGTGPYISGSAIPTRSGGSVKDKIDMEKRWDRENAAFKRLDAQGYTLPRLDGADIIEKNATAEIELKHGKLYGDLAPAIDKAAKEEAA